MSINRVKLSRIDEILREEIEAGHIVGANALVWQDGQERYYAEAGLADIAAAKPIRRDTIFRLYSMSKPITGAACMLLVERGQLDLNDPVSRYLPAFRDQQVVTATGTEPARREMTIHDLLGMTSGLVYGGPDSQAGRDTEAVWQKIIRHLADGSDLTTQQVADLFGGCALQYHPGESWQYGCSADVAGAVIEAVTGKTFGQFLREEFFAPLQMNDTDFYVPADKQSRLAKAYRETENGPVLYSDNHLGILNAMDRPAAFESGGAGLVSTIDDYLQFARMLMNGGSLEGRRILSPVTVKAFASSQLLEHQQKAFANWNGLEGYGYGHFMRVMKDPAKAVMIGSEGEYGWDGWLGCYFANLPKLDTTILLMVQRVDSGTLAFTRRIRNVVLCAME